MSVSRRRFLQQTIGFSAAVALGGNRTTALAASTPRSTPSAIPAVDSLHLLAIGDFGVKPNDLPRQQAVADAMAKYLRNNRVKPDALALLGDNFYGGLKGKGVRSPRWEQNIEGMYRSDVFDCPMFAMLGNHDYGDEKAEACVAAQLAYKSYAPDSRWLMPSKWYTLELPEKRPLAKIVVLDTMRFDKSAEAKAQLEWVKKELGKPRTTPWLFVMGHHPLYSDGTHGDQRNLIAALDPLFRDHKVDLYISGHDHDLQHIEFAKHPTSFVISGGGGARARDFKTKDRSVYGGAVYGFTHLDLRDKSFTVRHLDANNKLLHAFTKERGGKMTVA
jgi:tartrate-resistant acid phosphatase type 5